MGSRGEMIVAMITANVPRETFHHLIFRTTTRIPASKRPNAAVSFHLYAQMKYIALLSGPVFPQLAKTRINTSDKNKDAICHIGFPPAGMTKPAWPSARFSSSFLNKKAMINPMITLNTTAPMILAIPSSNPSILAVSMIARMLMAGPEYKNAMAGPNPAPRLYMLAKSGRIVQLQTASMVPETEATRYAFHFAAVGPRYLATVPWPIKTAITPAIKKAGIRQSRTCSLVYHLSSINASETALSKTSVPDGMK